jgi:hypothetical protein
MPQPVKRLMSLVVIIMVAVVLVPVGCSNLKDKWRRVSGTRAPDSDLEEEARTPPEARQDEVVIDGKVWIRSRNPYYLTMPNEPEYIYAEKGKELKTFQSMLIASVARKLGLDKKAQEGGVPPEKVQEMVHQEVDRLLREQGLRAVYSQEKGRPVSAVGRYVAVAPNPDNARSTEGTNNSLAAALTDYLSRLKDLKVAGPEKVRTALAKAKGAGTATQRQALQTLGDTTGIQALILTRVVPPSGRNPSFLVLEVYDTFRGIKSDGIAYPVEGTLDSVTMQRFVRINSLRVAAALMEVDWFGRVEFVKGDNVYLSLGDSAGLKVGDRLKVVVPGQEVVNPTTHASLGFTSDESQGLLKITELLGKSGAIAQVISGGPFKPNDKVRALK